MKISSKTKLLLNILLLVVILGIMFYLLQNSFGEILAELKSTSIYALITIFVCGTLYLIVEGLNIKHKMVFLQFVTILFIGLLLLVRER